MPKLVEGNLTFRFPEGWEVGKLDDWGFYRGQFIRLGADLRVPCAKCDVELRCQACGTSKTLGIKAVDILARAPNGTLWRWRRHVARRAGRVSGAPAYPARSRPDGTELAPDVRSRHL